MIVFRLEHIDCHVKANHGPRSGVPQGCNDWPHFGGNGRGPNDIEKFEICGVTDEQLDDWWSEDNYRGILPEGWAFVQYELLNRDTWHYDNNQVVFDPNYSIRREMADA